MTEMSKESDIVCFSAKTRVCLPDGSSAEIAKTNVGDSVLSYDQASRILVAARVETVVSSFHTEHVVLGLEDGCTLECTSDHPLWIDGKGWCAVDPRHNAENYGLATNRLLPRDKLCVLRDDLLKPVAIREVNVVKKSSTMFVIGTGSKHTFFANGILAHDENVGRLNLSSVAGVNAVTVQSGSHSEPALA